MLTQSIGLATFDDLGMRHMIQKNYPGSYFFFALTGAHQSYIETEPG